MIQVGRRLNQVHGRPPRRPGLRVDVLDQAMNLGDRIALVAQHAATHGGHVTVLDRPGGGARFRVELPAGLGSALPGTAVIDTVAMDNGVAVVSIGTGLQGTGRSDEVLAIGQVVCTLDARADVNGVAFVHDGQRVSVPRGDGSLSKDSLTTADYAVLLAQR